MSLITHILAAVAGALALGVFLLLAGAAREYAKPSRGDIRGEA